MSSRDTTLRIVIDAQDKASRVLGGVGDSLDRMQPTLQKMATIGGVAFGSLATALGLFAKEASEAEAIQFRLAHILRTSTGATDDQIAALNAQARALEKVGVVSGDAVTMAQAQLATFDLQADTIAKLTPAILDYAVAERGAAMTTEDLKLLTNGLAQALNGNFASLTRVGFVLDETTRGLISNGTEAERAAAIVQVLNSTYAGFNEAARQTSEGAMVALNNQFGELREAIGVQFLPVLQSLAEAITPLLEKLTAWVEKHPKLTTAIIVATLALLGIITALGLIGIVLPAVITGVGLLAAGFTIAATAMAAISLPMLGVIALLGVIGFSAYKVATQWEDAWSVVTIVVATAANKIQSIVEGIINFVIGAINSLIDRINSVIAKASEIPGLGKKFKDMSINRIENVSFERYDTGAVYNDMMARPATGGGNNFMLNVTGNNLLSEDVAEQIGDMIMSRLKLSNAM